MKSHYYGPNVDNKSDVLLSFYDHFVNFNYESLIQFASKNFKNYKLTKTCFIQLFDEKEAKLLTQTNNDDELKKIYAFLTRFYCSAFESSHHIHLFAKHHRADIDGDVGMRFGNKPKDYYISKMKSMNVYEKGNKLLKNHHLLSLTGSTIKILSDLLNRLIFVQRVRYHQ